MDKEVKGSLREFVTPDREIVISGLSGIFPKARNVHILAEKLYNKVSE